MVNHLNLPLIGVFSAITRVNTEIKTELVSSRIKLPGSSAAVSLDDIRFRLKKLERQDWWLWATAVLVMLLLTVAIMSLTFPGVVRENPFYWFDLDSAVHGLLGLVLLFSVFVIYQQVLIKRLRSQLASQLEEMAALETRAETFERLAIIDPLTELYNRRFATEHLPVEIARANRQGYPLTVLMLDLNGFKEINDLHGHAAGDAALLEFARHLKRCFRSSDLPVRMGGDEFMVVLPECSSDSIPKVLMHLRDLYVEHLETRIDIKFSAGWAQNRPNETAVELMTRADRALYADKETRNAEQQVRAAEAAMVQQQKMVTVGQMAGGVAHDFNNLLTVIRGYSELLLDYIPQGNDLREKVEEIDRAAQRAATLTRQLLSFTRKQPFDPEHRIDVNKILSSMQMMIRSLLTRGHTVSLDLATDLGLTRGDQTQIEQIVLNLVINARDAMPSGGTVKLKTGNIELDEAFASQHPGSRPGAYVFLSVSDTGVGMTEEVKAHIFEPFFTTKSGEQGTGLGLAIVYGVVKQTGSYIAVESEVDHGATFTVYFPRAKVTTEKAPAPEAAAAHQP